MCFVCYRSHAEEVMLSFITDPQIEKLRHIILKNNKEIILKKFISFMNDVLTDYLNTIIEEEVDKRMSERIKKNEIQDAKELVICPKCNCTDKKKSRIQAIKRQARKDGQIVYMFYD